MYIAINIQYDSSNRMRGALQLDFHRHKTRQFHWTLDFSLHYLYFNTQSL